MTRDNESKGWKERLGTKMLTLFDLLIALLAPALVISFILIAIGLISDIFDSTFKFEDAGLDGSIFGIGYSTFLVSGVFTYCGIMVLYFLTRDETRKKVDDIQKQLDELSEAIFEE